MSEYRIFLRKNLYGSNMNVLFDIIRRTLDSNNIIFDPSQLGIRVKIKKSYMKKNNIEANNSMYYSSVIAYIFKEFFCSNEVENNFTRSNISSPDFDVMYKTLLSIRELSIVEIQCLINATYLFENYVIIYL